MNKNHLIAGIVALSATLVMAQAAFARVSNPIATVPTITTTSTTATSTFAGAIKNANGNVLATLPSYVVSTTTATGDFTSITAALAALPSTGGKVSVTCGTFTLPAGGILWSYNNVTLEGQGECTRLNFNAQTGSVPVAIRMADTTQRSLNHIRNMRLSQSGTAGNGTCVDFSYFTISTFEQVNCDGAKLGYVASTTGTLYNTISNPRISVSGVGSYGYYVSNSANFNLLKKPRIVSTADTVGVYIDAHANACENCEVETGALVGVDVGANGHEAYLPNVYLEGNQTNLRLASGVEGVYIPSGFIADATTANITDNGAQFFSNRARVQYAPVDYTTGSINMGIGTSTPNRKLSVSSGSSATTTVQFGDLYSTTGKTCFEGANSAGGIVSFYFNAANTMVIEGNACR